MHMVRAVKYTGKCHVYAHTSVGCSESKYSTEHIAELLVIAREIMDLFYHYSSTIDKLHDMQEISELPYIQIIWNNCMLKKNCLRQLA